MIVFDMTALVPMVKAMPLELLDDISRHLMPGAAIKHSAHGAPACRRESLIGADACQANNLRPAFVSRP